MIYETETEDLFRKKLRENNYYDNENIHIEEKHSKNLIVNKLLANASKTGGEGKGQPEFIITHTKYPYWILVEECKAAVVNHESINRDNYAKYAVDGVLLYAKYLSKQFNVIAIALSGNETNHKISTFFWGKNDTTYTDIKDSYDNFINDILSFDKYVCYAKKDFNYIQHKREELKKLAVNLHNYIRERCKLGESEKPLLISGILLALHNPSFKKSYDEEPSNLCTFLYDSISSELDKADIPNVKKENMKSTYYFIKTHDDLVKDKNGDIPLQKIIHDIDKNFDHINDFDSIGEFYKEFLRYTGEDKQGLGIVLTPHHITDLFTELADVTKNNVVLDTCAGTGGYLISAMYKMFIGANDNEKEKIKSEQLIGIEQNMKMFTLMCSNMLLRGDGKANLYRGDSFDNKIIKKIKGKADVGMMNPPYSQKEEGLQEFNFIENLLDCLKVGGKGIVIVPMSCALTTKSYNQMIKEKILKKHRLEAVLSMPDQLFNPIGTITCIMIFTAHVPHTKEHRTWFGYCKDDGFELLKHRGRIDVNNRWHDIKKYWLDAYRNKKEIAGFSVLQHVDVNDEWCAEAYMETDYSFLKVEDFEREIKKYLLFKELGCDISD